MISRSLVIVSIALLGSFVLGPSSLAQSPELRTPAERAVENAPFVPVVFEGFVFQPDGAPAEGAVVLSSAGGRAVTDASGRYRLPSRLPAGAESARITASHHAGGNLRASTNVVVTAAGPAWVDPLALTLLDVCAPEWLPTFGGLPGTSFPVSALTVFDDGSGPALYVGGAFTIVAGVAIDYIAKWDGTSWTSLGSGTNGSVRALTVFDDGGGAALYAGGTFSSAGGVGASGIAKWNGSSWSSLGSGVNSAVVEALAVFDDGGGPALYAGGNFTTAGGGAANRIAKWDGSSWSALGSGTNLVVLALTVFGSKLIAGGGFTTAGGGAANRIASWDGSSWSALGGGMFAPIPESPEVSALAVFDDGGGPALYAGGSFTTAGGVASVNIAKWDGSSWTAVGDGLDEVGNPVRALSVFDDGGGSALFAGGAFTDLPAFASNIAKWDGSSWSAVGAGTNDSVGALAVFDDGSGPALFAGGAFTAVYDSNLDPVEAHHVARWDGSSWAALGDSSAPSDAALALSVFDDGGGPALFAGGAFQFAGGVKVGRIAKWDGAGWTELDGGMASGQVMALTVFDDGGGPNLFVGGSFTNAGPTSANRMARWDGSSWATVGSFNNTVSALAVFDDGGGPALYAGGSFTSANGAGKNRIAKWNGGTSWSALGTGMSSTVSALAVFDDGGGLALYAGGFFTTAGGSGANRIAKWNGSSWAPLGSGTDASIVALTVFDDGGGPALYAGGSFTSAGGSGANRIAKWNGSSWSALGSGMDNSVTALAVFDDGSGPALYAGGVFTTAGGVAASKIAKWDGSSWTAIGSGMSGNVQCLAVFDDDTGAALFAGGSFASAIDSGDSFLAKLGCEDVTPPTLVCPESVLENERLGSPPGEVVTFTVTATDDNDPSPDVVCVPPSGSFFSPGRTIVTCTATDAAGNQAACQFPVVVVRRIH